MTTNQLKLIPFQFDDTYHALDRCSWGLPEGVFNTASDQNRVVALGIIAIPVVIFYIACLVLFMIRRKLHPLRERSPNLLMVSAIAGAITLAYMYFRQFFDIVFACPMSYYIILMATCVFFIPYLLRCYRTIMLWELNVAKAAMMQDGGAAKLKTAGGGDGVTGRVQTLLNRRRLFSEGFLLIILGIFSAVWILGGFIVQISAWQANAAFVPSCPKQCNLDEGTALKVFVVIMAVMLIVYAIFMYRMRNITDESSIRNELAVLLMISSVCVVIEVIFIFFPAYFWPRQAYVGYILAINMVFSFIISVVYPLLRTYAGFNRFSNKIIAKIRGGNTATDNDVMSDSSSSHKAATTPRGSNSSVSSPTTPAPTAPLNNTPDSNTGSVAVTIDPAPASPSVAAAAAPPKSKKDSFLSFEWFLEDNDGKECFKKFLVREFSVENLMFWTELQYYKRIEEEDELKTTANNLFETYIQMGSPFEINIPMETRDAVQNLLKSQIDRDTFKDAEQAVFETMKNESFPRFTSSKMYSQFVKEKKAGKKV